MNEHVSSDEGGEGLLSVILAASPGTPTLTCRKIADAVADRLAAVQAEAVSWAIKAGRLSAQRDAARRDAEGLRARLEAVEALADEWAEDYPSDLAACNYASDKWWRDLRAALANPPAVQREGEGS